MRKLLWSMFCLSVGGACFAQAADTVKAAVYIQDLNKYVSFKLDFERDSESFVVQAPNTTLELRPNALVKSRLSLNYRFLSFGFSYAPDFLPGNGDEALRGASEAFSVGLHFYFSHFVQSLRLSQTKGYYLYNTSDVQQNWTAGIDPFVQFPNLVVSTFSGYTGYKWNEKLSLRALSTQTEWQVKSVGSFVSGLHYAVRVNDDQTPITANSITQASRNFEAILSQEYIYTLVLNRNWYLSGGASVGGGWYYTELFLRSTSDTFSVYMDNPVGRIGGRGALGFNSERWFGGAEVNAFRDYRNQALQNASQRTTGMAFQLFVGYRFKAPRKVDAFMEKVETKIPFL